MFARPWTQCRVMAPSENQSHDEQVFLCFPWNGREGRGFPATVPSNTDVSTIDGLTRALTDSVASVRLE